MSASLVARIELAVSQSATSWPRGLQSVCSESCADEFARCAGLKGYTACREEIDSQRGPLATAGCEAYCADTASMAAFNTGETDDSPVVSSPSSPTPSVSSLVANGLGSPQVLRLPRAELESKGLVLYNSTTGV